MSDKQNNGLRKAGIGLFTAIGGALLGAGLGGTAGALLGAWAYSGSTHGGRDDMSIGGGIVVLMFIGAGAVAGAGFGSFLLPLISLVRQLRIVSIVLACMGYAAGLYGVVWHGRFQSDVHRITQRADASIDAKKREDARLSEAYLKVANADVPRLLGPLYYPGSEIMPTLEHTVDRTYPRIEFVTSDPYSDVVNYYRKAVPARVDMLTGNSSEPYRAKTARPGDGRAVYLVANKLISGKVTIAVMLASSVDVAVGTSGSGAASSVDSPHIPQTEASGNPANASPASTVQTPAEALAAAPDWAPITEGAGVSAHYGSLVYPGSRQHVQQTATPGSADDTAPAMLATADPYDRVTAYYKPSITPIDETPASLLGTCRRASDGKFTFVRIFARDGLTTISLSTSSIAK